MIKVKTFTKEAMYIGFDVEGHADYDEHGKDIVCAAVSILVQTCVNSLNQIINAKFDFEENEKTGKIKLILSKNSETDLLDKASLLIESMSLGIKGIAELYPKNVKVYSQEV